MKIIERKEYLDRLIRLKDTPDIKIITGLRRSGKSELVRAYENIVALELLRRDYEIYVGKLYQKEIDLTNWLMR